MSEQYSVMNVREKLEKIYEKNKVEKTAEDVLKGLYEELSSIPIRTINDESDPHTEINVMMTRKNVKMQDAMVVFVSDLFYIDKHGLKKNHAWNTYWNMEYTPTYEDFKKWCNKNFKEIRENPKFYAGNAKFIHAFCWRMGRQVDKTNEIPENGGKGVDLDSYVE